MFPSNVTTNVVFICYIYHISIVKIATWSIRMTEWTSNSKLKLQTFFSAPLAPSMIPEDCSAENNSVTVAWQAPSHSFIEGYVLELDDGSGGEFRVSTLIYIIYQNVFQKCLNKVKLNSKMSIKRKFYF